MTDELPPHIQAKVQQYRVRQVLWAEFGLSWPDWTFEEIVEALELHNADQEHVINVTKRASKPRG